MLRFLSVRALRWLALLGTLGPAAAVTAQSHAIAILSLSSDDDEAAASALTGALRTEAEAVDTLRPSSTRASLSQMTIAQDCEISDPQCRIRIANALSVELVIYGEINRARGDFEADLHMFGSDGAQVSATEQVPSRDVARKNLSQYARELLRKLQEASSPNSAAAAPATTGTPTVTPDVAPLHEEPRERELPEKKPAPVSNDWIGYTLLGVAGASVALTILSWTQISAANKDENLDAYRKAVGSANLGIGDACGEADKGHAHGATATVLNGARDACSKGRTFEALQYVFLGSALVAGGVGTYFLLDNEGNHDNSAARLRVRPEIVRKSATLRLSLEF